MASATNTITVGLTIDSVVYDMSNTFTTSSATDAYIRRVNVDTTEIQILQVGATVAAGKIESIRGLVIHNLSTKNTVRIRFTETGSNQTAIFRIPPKGFHNFGNAQYSVNNTGGAFVAFVNVASIYASAEYDDATILFIAQHD